MQYIKLALVLAAVPTFFRSTALAATTPTGALISDALVTRNIAPRNISAVTITTVPITEAEQSSMRAATNAARSLKGRDLGVTYCISWGLADSDDFGVILDAINDTPWICEDNNIATIFESGLASFMIANGSGATKETLWPAEIQTYAQDSTGFVEFYWMGRPIAHKGVVWGLSGLVEKVERLPRAC